VTDGECLSEDEREEEGGMKESERERVTARAREKLLFNMSVVVAERR